MNTKTKRLSIRQFEITPEVLARIRGDIDAVQGEQSKDIRCAYCGRLILRKFPDAQGHISGKCAKCGREYTINVANWRRVPQY
ncbi:MAG: hypothetical protein LBQ91_05450 [Oscillospiraceae bacterium]|jgi:phage FluMu protein Com|nr:hypothetical protein [Oscillospiraceae bacterium]